MADVGHCGNALHRLRIAQLERVVQSESVYVHLLGLQTRVGEQRDLALHQLPFRRDEQHVHLQAVAVGIEHLEVELHSLDVEGDVLLRFPAHDFRRIRLLHAIDLNLLHNHVAATHGDNDAFLLDACEQSLDRF